MPLSSGGDAEVTDRVELRQLEYFKMVADNQKISATAQALFISPPALSATITRLEKELGVKLFDRMTNSIKLNKQGEIFLRYVNLILSTIRDAKQELHQSMVEEKKHIRMAVTTSNLWIGMICAFSLEHPEITLSYTTLKLSQVRSGNIDTQYQFLLAEEGDLESDLLLHSELLIEGDRPVLMAPPNHPLAQRTGIDISELADETFLLPIADLSLHRMATHLLSNANLQQKAGSAYECSYMVRRSMVLAQRGISFSTEYTSRAEDPGLCYIPIDAPYYRWNHRIYWSKSLQLTEEEQLFVQFAKAYFARQG